MSIELTDEQKSILQGVDTSSYLQGRGKLILITAGAGTGKTFTLLKLAERYTAQAKEQTLPTPSITYVTFNKSAATDGKRRLQQVVPELEARTLHSCAMSTLSMARQEDSYDEEEVEKRILSDQQLQKRISELAKKEIEEFLKRAFATIRREEMRQPSTAEDKIRRRQEQAREQVIFFLFKTLLQFCRKDVTLEFLSNRNPPRYQVWKRNYYPAMKYHESKGGGPRAGFEPGYYLNKIGFYADTIAQLWLHPQLRIARSFDLEMKRAQLENLSVRGDVILADECQDMDECQISFLTKQAVHHGKTVYFVGDAAQTIYSFRGAKSENMFKTEAAEHYTLSRSFRFGPGIASVANVILFAKEFSPQTKKEKKTWHPYRLVGRTEISSFATSKPFDYKDFPFTMIAFANATLMVAAVSMMGMSTSTIEEGGGKPLKIPKFHINGKGESGMKKWNQIMGQVQSLYSLFSKRKDVPVFRLQLQRDIFPEFRAAPVSWVEFLRKKEARDLSRYTPAIQVILRFGDQTLDALKIFRENVLEQKYTSKEADVILSTCHAAKGMEWDRVQVCDDFLKLHEVQKVGQKWQFKVKGWGDDLNVLYVACTRARNALCVPKSMHTFLDECDKLHAFANKLASVQHTGIEFLEHKNMTFARAKGVDNYLIQPMREELGMEISEFSLADRLLKPESMVVTPDEAPDDDPPTPSAKRSLFMPLDPGPWKKHRHFST